MSNKSVTCSSNTDKTKEYIPYSNKSRFVHEFKRKKLLETKDKKKSGSKVKYHDFVNEITIREEKPA